MPGPLDITVTDGVRRITMRRPEAFNSLNRELLTLLVDALRSAADDEATRVVVVTGEGRAFCAGADLSGPDPVSSFSEETMEGANTLVRAVVECPKPVVAAVNGIAAGLGASVCFAADLQMARESASFLLAFARVGLMTDGGASLTVAAAAGRTRAMRMALLAEPMGAREAAEAGLVSHVVADDEFEAEVDALAQRLAAGAPLALAASKSAVNAATLGGLEAALERESAGQLALFATADAAEGMRAFVEKRPSVFRGE
jgi:enoyl-CoA hydratase